jgi:hypothetical protein
MAHEQPTPFYDAEYVRKLFAQILVLGKRIESLPTKEMWFRNLLVSFVNALIREERGLSAGLKGSTPMLAWACRNMLELDISIKYSLESRVHGRSFVDDMWTDGIQVFQAFRSSLLRMDPKRDVSGVEQIIANFEAGRLRVGNTRTKYIEVRDMAEVVGMSEDYRDMNRVTSKLVHQTSLAVMIGWEDEHRPLRVLLHDVGVRFALDASAALEKHVDSYGADPVV